MCDRIAGDGIDRARLQSAMPTAVFTGARYGKEPAEAYASMDVFAYLVSTRRSAKSCREALVPGLPVTLRTPADRVI